jgi:hypothetical protein
VDTLRVPDVARALGGVTGPVASRRREWLRPFRQPLAGPIVLLVIGCLLGRAPACAQMIPPGQEGLLAAMLGSGAPLPGGCSFVDGQIDHEVVRATYHCPYGEVVMQLSHPSARAPSAITTKRFALTVASGSPHDDLLEALEARIRSKESEFGWSMLVVGKNGRSYSSVLGLPTWLSALLLLALAGVSSISAWRAWATRAPVGRRAAFESLLVAAIVVMWLQIDAAPPAHMDTAVDVALARDCITSSGSSCLGHAASAIGLVQGQAFTYALALWLYLGFSMRELCFVAACILGAATGLLHHAIARRFGGVAWVVSAFVSALGVYMTGYPTIWNPSWFVLPLTVAFVATLALAGGSGIWSAFVAGVAFALTSESHLLFGMFIAVAVLVVLITAREAAAAAGVLLASFVLTEIVISPVSSTLNALILRGWVGAHPVPATALALLFCASLPIQLRLRRAIRGNPAMRELVTVLVWMLAGAVGLGLVLPWAVSRPPQIRYYGAAFPAIGYAVGWLLDAATLRARSWSVRIVAVVIFAAIFWNRMTTADFARAAWLMDDGMGIPTIAGLVNTSALDIQLMVRPLPDGALGPVAAAFVGTADAPSFPTRIVRAVLPQPGVELPAGWSRVRRARGEIFTSDIDAWTHPEEAEICPDPPNGDPCVTLTHDDFSDVARNAGGLLHRVFGLRIVRSATRIGEWTKRGTRSLLWKIPLHTAGPDATRVIVFHDAMGEQIVAVDGTPWTADAENHAVVERPAPDAAASITVRTPIADKFEAGVPPLPFELREGEVGVLPEQAEQRR